MKTNQLFVTLSVLVLAVTVLTASRVHAVQPEYAEGVWNNFDFSAPASYWSEAAHRFGGENPVIDLVVAQANVNGLVYLPFPFQSTGNLYSSSESDRIEPYLTEFDSENLSVILSIQSLGEDIPGLIEMLLSMYGDHRSIIGVNIDLEWKTSDVPYHTSNEERDAWLNVIKSYGPQLRLFLTYFGGYEYFPDDTQGLTVLFDGENELQSNILNQYRELAEHYESVGLYTGYSTSTPPAILPERILDAVPNTKYIIHTYDVASEKKILIFQMDDIQVDWLESTTTRLIDVHLEKQVPVICGIIPINFDNPNVGGGFLANNFKDIEENYFDVFDIAQHGYTHSESEMLLGKSYDEQKTIIENGLNALTSAGLEPRIFVPPFGAADETTVKVVEDLGFSIFVDFYQGLSSQKLEILDTWISLTERIENETVLKTPEKLMTEIDEKPVGSPVIIHYQIFDVDGGSRRRELSSILDELKESGKYRFMTATQYVDNLRRSVVPSDQASNETESPVWPLVLVFGLISAIVVVLITIAKKRRKETGQTAIQHAKGNMKEK